MALAALAAVAVVGCSNATPTATPIDAETAVELARQAMSDFYAYERDTSIDRFNRGTGERNTEVSEETTTHISAAGEWSSVTIYNDGNGPVRTEDRCVDGQRFTWHPGFGWDLIGSKTSTCSYDRLTVVNRQLDLPWISEPELTEEGGTEVLRLLGETVTTGQTDGQPDPSSFTITSVILDLEPSNYRIVKVESVAKSYVSEDSWGIKPPSGEPVSTFTVVTTFSSYGEPYVIEAPAVAE